MSFLSLSKSYYLGILPPPSYTYPIHLYQPPRHPGAGTSLPHTHSRTTHFFSLVQLAKPSIGKWNYDASTWSKRENSVAWEWFEDLAECPTLTKLWSPQGQVFSFCAQTLNIPVFDQKVVSCCCPRDGELQIRIFLWVLLWEAGTNRTFCQCHCEDLWQLVFIAAIVTIGPTISFTFRNLQWVYCMESQIAVSVRGHSPMSHTRLNNTNFRE